MPKLSYKYWRNSKYTVPDIVLEEVEKESGPKAAEELLHRHYEDYLRETDK